MQKDPIKHTLWGMIIGNIENMGIFPVLQGGEAIAKALEGATVLERLTVIDGEGNQEITEGKAHTLVVLKACPFTPIYKEIPPWGDKSMALVKAYNMKADGGGALHPLCLVHKGIRNGMKAGIISIGCRSAAGLIEVAEKSLDKVGMTKDEALAMLAGKACLFAIPKS